MLTARRVRRIRHHIRHPARLWFYRPAFHWFGPRTLLPVFFGWDEYDWHTVVLGWSVTGRMVIATSHPTEIPPFTPSRY